VKHVRNPCVCVCVCVCVSHEQFEGLVVLLLRARVDRFKAVLASVRDHDVLDRLPNSGRWRHWMCWYSCAMNAGCSDGEEEHGEILLSKKKQRTSQICQGGHI
jgi:hypothetical protein